MKLKITLAAALALGAAAGTAARADEHGGPVARLPPLPLYGQECGACHAPFPPGLLPSASWQRLMEGLPRHFGTDASVDAATRKTLGVWLAANAGSGKRARSTPPEDRITRSDWFVREHREVPTPAWTRASIRSAANCAACHDSAAQGLYSEHDVRIPR